jgi:hypothetical protein
MARAHTHERHPGTEASSDTVARKTFYIALAGCLLFALAVFVFVLR